MTYLFVGKYQEHSALQLILIQHSGELFSRLLTPFSIIAVHNKYKT